MNFDRLFTEAFAPDYLGYRPNVVENPHGDARADTGKRYSHIAPKYAIDRNPYLQRTYQEMFDVARLHARRLYVDIDYCACALRVLEYAPGVGGTYHTDFDMFTMNVWRSHPNLMHEDGTAWGNIHFGELWTEIGCGEATGHFVEAHPTETQRSIVFFALPSHYATLPSGVTVGAWLNERISRSRSYK